MAGVRLVYGCKQKFEMCVCVCANTIDWDLGISFCWGSVFGAHSPNV